MEFECHTVNLEIRPGERDLVEKELERIREVVRNFPRPVAHVGLERSPRKGGYGVSLHVKLSTKSLFATAWGGDFRSAVESAVDKVVRQAKRHVSILRRNEHAGAESLRDTPPPPPPSAADLVSVRDLEDFRDHVSDHVARLHAVLRREVSFNPRFEEVGGRISLPDIVEDALVYVFEHFREKPQDMTPDRWLVRRGLIFLDQELKRLAEAPASEDETGSAPSRDSIMIPEDWEELMQLPVADPSRLESQPADEAQASPEVVGAREAAQQETAEALRALPERQRMAVLLRHVEGYGMPEIAYVLNADEKQVEGWLLEGETTLQDRLSSWRGL